MKKLIAISFDDIYGASNAIVKLDQLQENYLLTMEDVVIATIREDGKVKLSQSVDLVKIGAAQGGFWGGLIGLILTGPLGMLLIGGTSAAFGALIGSLSDYGINDDFIRKLGRKLEPGSSALFILVNDLTMDKVVEKLEGLNGEIIQTSLPKESEEKLRQAIEAQKVVEIQ